MTKTKANLLILFVAALYGAYFVVMKTLSNQGFGPSSILFFRNAFFLAAAAIYLGKGILKWNRAEIFIGSLIGFLDFVGFLLQAFGNKYSTPSNNAFLTCLNTVLVPLFAWLFYKKRPSKKVYIAIPAALAGMALLTNIFSSAGWGIGDVFSLACAVVFAAVIVLLGNAGQKIDFKKLVFMLAAWQAVGGFVMFGALERFALPPINWLVFLSAFLFLGLACSFLTTVFQIYAQRFTSETATGMLLALQSVFASAISIAAGLETFTLPLLFGGLLITAAVMFLVIDFTSFKKKPKIQKEQNNNHEGTDAVSETDGE
ncbi:MAG: DMT family transporter [Clostridiales bacterium]|jgi:drug/metabolite transporter (DMT)-like permease|nr:DMT family transporter [Clostridiales bacterium]